MMFSRSVTVAAAVFSVAVLTRVAVPVAADQQSTASMLPAGAGKEVVAKFCDDCHTLSTTVARRRLPSEWRDVIDKMYTQGLTANDEEDAKIFAYLCDQLGKVDLNKGTVKELRAVLDITKEDADAIIAARPFAFPAYLAKVPGFDSKKAAPLLQRIVVTPIKKTF
jgi:cytochrome c5